MRQKRENLDRTIRDLHEKIQRQEFALHLEEVHLSNKETLESLAVEDQKQETV